MKAALKKPAMTLLQINHMSVALILFAILAMASCSKDDSIAPEEDVSSTSQKSHASANQLTNSWRLVIDFESSGPGIDYNAMNALREFVNSYQNNAGVQLVYQSNFKGKEGEVAYRFHLHEIDEDNQPAFIAAIRNLMMNHPTVHVYENVAG